MLEGLSLDGRAQIALEFMIVYSFVLVIFVLLFALISTQRAATLSQQQYALLQLQAQNVASYINQALASGNGYSAKVPISGTASAQPYNLSISTTGVVITQQKVGTQILRAYAFSDGRSLQINSTQTQSSNGISVYLVPILSGTITIANSNGQIYVDNAPVSTSSLPQFMTVQASGARAANFNGATSNVNVGSSNSLLLTSPISISAWVSVSSFPSSGANDIVDEYNGGSCNGYSMWITSLSDWRFGKCGDSGSTTIGSTLSLNKFYFLTATYDGTTYKVYTNGALASTNTHTATFSPIGPVYIGSGTDSNFNGQIADVQVYNAVLASNQISQLYQEGIGGAPIILANTVGWWPLNNNTIDYSGFDNVGSPVSVGYNSMAQIRVHVNTTTGANSVSDLVGLVSSNGAFNQIYTANAPAGIGLYTNSTGYIQAFTNTLGDPQSFNITTFGFNGNQTTVGNLVGWWPLEQGFNLPANKIYDLSTNHNDGTSIILWAPLYGNSTNLLAAGFNTLTTNYISVPNSAGFNIISSKVSLSAWVKIPPSTPAAPYYIIDKPISGGSIPYSLDVGSGGVRYPRFIITNSLNSLVSLQPSGNIFDNNWHFVAGTYDGSYMRLYVDGVQTGVTAQNGKIITTTNSLIIGGFVPPATPGANYFNGNISNVQIYNTTLSPGQVSQLYREGVAATPVQLNSTVGWWPLIGNANDYSGGGNTGTAFNVIYVNQFANVLVSSSIGIASFNSLLTQYPLNIPDSPSLDFTTGGTWSLWVYPTNSFLGTSVDIMNKNSEYSITCNNVNCNFQIGTGASANVVTIPVQNIPLNTWTALTYTFGGSALNVYVNGVLKGSARAIGPIPTTTNPLALADRFFHGYIIDFQVYNGPLSTAQVSQLYQQGLPLYQRRNVTLG